MYIYHNKISCKLSRLKYVNVLFPSRYTPSVSCSVRMFWTILVIHDKLFLIYSSTQILYSNIYSLKLTFSIPEYLEFAQQQTYEMECVVLLLYWYSGEARPTSLCHAAQIFMCTWKTINFWRNDQK